MRPARVGGTQLAVVPSSSLWPGTHFFGVALGILGASGAQSGLVPVVAACRPECRFRARRRRRRLAGSTRVSDTSAMPVGLRSRVPAKMTSCMLTPRSSRADCSPSTQEMASEMFDLPQPLGPTMAAMPSPWKRRSVRSQNDLKPRICSFFSLSNVTPASALAGSAQIKATLPSKTGAGQGIRPLYFGPCLWKPQDIAP